MKKQTYVCILILIMGLFQSTMLVWVFGQEEALVQKIFDKHKELLLRPDIQNVFPDVLTALKDPAIQPLLTADTLTLFVTDPDALDVIFPTPDDDFIMLLKGDAAVKAFFGDADVQALLSTPTTIEKLIALIREGEPDKIDEIPAKKLFKVTRHFINSRSVRQRHWSSTLKYPGTVIQIEGHWSSHSKYSRRPVNFRTFVDKVTVRDNTVTVYGEQSRTLYFGALFPDYLEGTLTVVYSSEPMQPTVDVNSDDAVNVQDLVFVASQFGPSGKGSVDKEARTFMWELNSADVNWNGVVNIQDLVLVAGAIGGDAAAPAIDAASIAILSSAEVQQWLEQARQLAPTDVPSQRGIAILEQLLSVLTPKETLLLPSYPNPFNPETWIPYHLAESADGTLDIYSADGKLVRTLALGHQPTGIYESKSRAAYWDGRNAMGERVASGVYFYTLTAGDFAATGKMLIMK